MRYLLVVVLVVFLGSVAISCSDSDTVCSSRKTGKFFVDSLFPTFIVERDNGTIYSRARCRWVYHFEKRPGNVLRQYLSVDPVGFNHNYGQDITNIFSPKPIGTMYDNSIGYGTNINYSYLDSVDLHIKLEGMFWEWSGEGMAFDDRIIYGFFSWEEIVRIPVENNLGN